MSAGEYMWRGGTKSESNKWNGVFVYLQHDLKTVATIIFTLSHSFYFSNVGKVDLKNKCVSPKGKVLWAIPCNLYTYSLRDLVIPFGDSTSTVSKRTISVSYRSQFTFSGNEYSTVEGA